jgi:uncharacterized protein (DUF302 family)
MSITLERPFDDAVTDVRGALAGEGVGVISEIDLQATLRTKLGVEIDAYLILGARNPAATPPTATDCCARIRRSGCCCPCNVVIRRADAGTVVEMIDPQMLG